LASGQEEVLQASLRAFELLLLREIGLLPSLDSQTLTMHPLDQGERYCLARVLGWALLYLC